MKRFERMSLSAYASAGVILLAVVALPSATGAFECQPVNETEIKQLFVDWNNTLKKPDPEHPTPDAVVQRYATDAVLLPTVDIGPYTDHKQIEGYFSRFLLDRPSGAIDPTGKRTISIGCNEAFDAGLYIFTYNPPPERPRKGPTKARYTYVYKYIGDKWLIAHHHSSVWPPSPPSPPPPPPRQ